jgi:phosphoesterase RecJ-like protein
MTKVVDEKRLPFTPELLNEVRELLMNANNILILSHRGPDGDTVGANLALRHALEGQWGKKVTSACVDPPPEYSRVLKGAYQYVNDFDLNDYDLRIAVDCGAHYMFRFHETKPEILDKSVPFINIDHHPSNDNFGTHNLVHDTAAAAVFTVYHMLKHFNLKITPDIASALLLGLYFDTGSFMHSNTTPEVLEMGGELIAYGADRRKIVKALLHTNPVSQLKLWGRVLKRARLSQKNAVVSAITNKDFEECGAEPEDLSGVIDFLNAVPGGKLAVLLTEDQKGNIKGSMRTQREDIDLSRLAGIFGGGGHKKASGFTIQGKLEPEMTWKIGEPVHQ